MTRSARKPLRSDLFAAARDLVYDRGKLEQYVRLLGEDTDLYVRIANVLTVAAKVFGDTEAALIWLKTPNEALGGAVPFRLLATIEGEEVVGAELGAIDHGLPA